MCNSVTLNGLERGNYITRTALKWRAFWRNDLSCVEKVKKFSCRMLTKEGIVRGNDPYLYGEKIKAYLRRGARPIRGEQQYPNDKVGYGALCVENSLPR